MSSAALIRAIAVMAGLALAPGALQANGINLNPDPPVIDLTATVHVQEFAVFATGSTRTWIYAGGDGFRPALPAIEEGQPLLLKTNHLVEAVQIDFQRQFLGSRHWARADCDTVNSICGTAAYALFDVYAGLSAAPLSDVNYRFNGLNEPLNVLGDRQTCPTPGSSSACGFGNGDHTIYVHPRRQNQSIFDATNTVTTAGADARFILELEAFWITNL